MAELITSIRQLRRPVVEPVAGPQTVADRLQRLANEVIAPNNMQTKGQITDKIQERTGVSEERAERGFAMMIDGDVILMTLNPTLFYLGNSTPF